MKNKEDFKNAAKVQPAVNYPPEVNPVAFSPSGKKKKRKYSADEYVEGILSGNRTILSQAITFIESTLPDNAEIARQIIDKCFPLSSRSVRIGITGAPGVGKSNFIESFGLHLTRLGRKIAVLAIDPSSAQTKGSILGDKTRMEKLSIQENAYIRPSPSAGTLGGVADRTRETIILCEAAGFDTIIVETVGVGQSETAVRTMVDFFLLLLSASAGDELQGIKRGIMEMADGIAVTKADGPNRLNAERARISFQNAMNLFPLPTSGWKPAVMTCSAHQNSGIAELWDNILEYVRHTTSGGYFEKLRKEQEVTLMHAIISESLTSSFYSDKKIKPLLKSLEKQLYEGKITSHNAAFALLDKYHIKRAP
ncbi:MAG TPA: methylmalonyl Co-A mutase-associated GTPase MeaB [Bacteroidales bacterium]|nr:methylmalonyl Co-A mutase-associated GTPase MeaB [Bacteroidales bacterium]HPM17981.1 methylmalonyl Co-A mutase-associated GTPase MeaB [Bacteroidales bacterium]HQG77615.1 methylmalonyl Co-A mutase-associated GTPase MeaB [Bacteroidales bacterium]